MQKKSGINQAMATCVGGVFICTAITGIIPGGSNEERVILLVFMGIIFLCGVIVVCTYRIVNAIKEMKEMLSDDKSIEYKSGKFNVDKKMGDKYGR